MTPDLTSYDRIVVAFSGGKDSLACLLHIFDLGVDKSKIELWHHDVDGREGSSLMDWPCTRDYCAKVAKALEVELCFSWKVGGFEGELLRNGEPTAPIRFQAPHASGSWRVGGEGPNGTRLRFPQVSGDLRVRWCSPYLKIDVGAAAIRNDRRFNHSRTLFVTGERAEESKNREKYLRFEPHRTDLRDGTKRRHVDQWRPVHGWTTAQVWALIERYRINPHPAYRLGWGRVSCSACIFGSPNQWASLRAVNPAQFEKVAQLEARLGADHAAKSGGTPLTIQRKRSVRQLADAGTVYPFTEADRLAAISHAFNEPIILDEWKLPAGAFGESAGPT